MRSPVLLVLLLSMSTFVGCDGSRGVEPVFLADGGLSAKSAASAVSAPSNAVAGGASGAQIELTWTDNSSNETGFEVHRSTDGPGGSFWLLTTIVVNTVLHADQGLEPGKEYCYRVRAVRLTGKNLNYSSFSNTACANTASAPLPPEAPSNLVAAATLELQIDLTWRDESRNETSFQILRSWSGEAGPFYLLASKPADSEAHSDREISQPAGTLYCYYVMAVRENPTGNGSTYAYSARSNTACTTAVYPPPPTSPPQSAYVVGATPLSSSIVMVTTVAWDDPSPSPPARFYRSFDAGSTWQLVSLYQGMDMYVPSELSVCYRAIAYNEAGDGPSSNVACVTPPAGPTNFAATPLDAATLELTWTDNSAVETGYEVWIINRWTAGCLDAGYSEWEIMVVALPPNSTSWQTARVSTTCHNALSAYYVVATRDGGRSDPSEEVSATDPAPYTNGDERLVRAARHR